MKLVEQNVRLIDYYDIYQRIEYATRVCYNSLDNMTEDSYKTFIPDKINAGHYSVLEHSNICLLWAFDDTEDVSYVYQWLNAVKGESNARVFITIPKDACSEVIILSGNVRGWRDFFEYNLEGSCIFNEGYKDMIQTKMYEEYPMFFLPKKTFPVGNLEFMSEDEAGEFDPIHKSFTFEITTNRAISHQLVRHRDFSFAQESQRYCNYSRPKHGEEIKAFLHKDFLDKNKDLAYSILEETEDAYFKVLENKTGQAQDARMLLPNAVATKIIITARIPQLDKFFALRCDNHAQKEIREIAFAMRDMVDEYIYKGK